MDNGFSFPKLNSQTHEGIYTKKYYSRYNVPIDILNSIKTITDRRVFDFLCREAKYETNTVKIDSEWRKRSCIILGIDQPRLSRSLDQLNKLSFISKNGKVCMINPFVSFNGHSSKREKVVGYLENSL